MRIILTFALATALLANTKWLDVPFVEQKGAGCGSAAVAMLMQYWARLDPQVASAQSASEHIDELLPVTSRKGIRGKELQHFLEQNGFRAFVFDGELSDLVHHTEKGRPVLVCFGPNGEHGPLHYAVILGIDSTSNSVWMNDPARGKVFREDLDRFEKEWKRTDGWALLAVPSDTR